MPDPGGPIARLRPGGCVLPGQSLPPGAGEPLAKAEPLIPLRCVPKLGGSHPGAPHQALPAGAPTRCSHEVLSPGASSQILSLGTPTRGFHQGPESAGPMSLSFAVAAPMTPHALPAQGCCPRVSSSPSSPCTHGGQKGPLIPGSPTPSQGREV